MICPRCTSSLHWQSDFMCDEIYGCVCEKGVVGIYSCPYCKAHVEITTDCEGDICE